MGLLSVFLQIFRAMFEVVAKPLRPWKENTWNPHKDIPWDGPDSRPRQEARKIFRMMSSTGYDYEHRWYTSGNQKPDPVVYGSAIDRYLLDSGIIEDWPKGSTEWDAAGRERQLYKPPYKFTVVSILPTIVIMTPHDYTVEQARDDRSIFGAGVMRDHYYMGTRVKYDPDSLWFSPDLDIPPTPLKITAGEAKIIEFDSGAIELQASSERINTRRLVRP